MSEWITDRLPTLTDADQHGYVWGNNSDGNVVLVLWTCADDYMPWMPFKRPVPYVKAKRYKVYELSMDRFCVGDQTSQDRFAKYIPTREAAERIAAIYEEVMP